MAENDSFLRSTPASRLRWDVFLSFRGTDTREVFTEHLYTELERNGVRVFRDNDGLRRGDSLDPALFEAIEDSAASIAIISPNYASSRWCLEELTKICECSAEYRLILPVFYRVDPSDVRRQTGPFEAHFRKHESRYGEGVVGKWREAMRKVGGISGWVYTNSEAEEHQLIRSLLKRILNELSNTPEVVAPYIVGLDSRVEELMRLLDVKCTGIQILGIYGMGGIGKTTLAKALYNKLVSHFEYRSFVSNVRENSLKQKGLISLQKKVIIDLSTREAPLISDDVAGKKLIKTILHEKQVLVVLDDIDDVCQLNALAGRREWFSDGSRIIISTRDREVLPPNLVNKIYEVKVLDSYDSLKLFSYHALRREKPTKTLMDLALQIVSLTGGLPLALEVFGSSLFDKRRIEEWQDALQKLKLIRPYNLQDVLKISFDGLDEQEKCIFLDIACILLNPEMTRDYAVDVMTGCGFRGETCINTLIARSLVKVTGDNTLWMHDQIRDMGRQIVMHENLVDSGLRSRLWNHNEVLHVLKSWKGTRNVQGITLTSEMKFLEDKKAPSMASASSYLKEIYNRYFQHGVEEKGGLIFNTKQFGLMANLRLLQFRNVRLEGDFKHLPAELRWLQWKNCTLKCLPSGCPWGLTVLDLSESTIERVWNCKWWYTNKVAEKLIVLNLRKCFNLATTPDLSGNLALEKLILERCVRLTAIHKSVADLNTLRLLDLRDCDNLVEFPGDVSGLKHLEKLILSGCSKLSELPQNIGRMSSLRQLLLDKTSIEKLPDSIFRLTKLEKLSLRHCQLLKKLPDCIGKLDSLSELYLDDSALVELPNSIRLLANLEILSLMWCRSLMVLPNAVGDIKLLTKFWLNGSGVEELPPSVGTLSYLRNLSVGGCHHISKLPSSIHGLASMVELQLDGTSIIGLPDEIGDMKSLRELQMRNCLSLRSLPVTIGNLWALETLIIVDAAIVELPETIGMLQNLITLRLNKCKLLRSLPASIGNLRSLHLLFLDKTALTELPESFGMLSNLVTLIMSNNSSHEVPQNSEEGVEIKPKCIALPSSFSKLSSLEEFNARAWNISANIQDDFENLSSLEMLDLSRNHFCSLPSSLRELSCLKKLLLAKCKQLKVLPQLPSSLEELDALDCVALEKISELKNLKNLIYLSLTNCAKLMDIPGLECLKSLRRLHIGGCNLCSSAVKAKLDKVALKNLREASMPGSEIPDWFTPKMVRYLKCKHQELKAVIIGVVVSVDRQILDDLRDEQIVLVDIQAKIFRRDKEIFATDMPLAGVPKTHEDQFYLFRYLPSYPLFLHLEAGDMIQVAKRDPPFTKGVELKKCGLHLVFEYDDDYDGEEKSLDESQQTVSEKLTRFINDEKSHCDSVLEDESKMMQGREHKKVCLCGLYAVTGLLVLSLLLGLFHFSFLYFSNSGPWRFI